MKMTSPLPQLFLRCALGIGFILPVLDRLGVLGAPGGKNVTWGDWGNFVKYTHSLAPYLNGSLTNFAAIVVTAAEIIFGIGLIIGFKTQYMAIGSTLLTFIFGISMAIFINIYAPFGYPVFVFTGGAWLLAQQPYYKMSVDSLINKSKQV